MVAPFRARPRPLNNQYVVNEDPRKLDQVYTKLLGNGGEKMLTEEVKWLAVTHKSFDHGRRGYNDRLAFLGKRIVELQTSLGLIHSRLNAPASVTADQYGRTPFQHPALDGLEGLNQTSRAEMIECARVAGVAERYGLLGVIRWKPRKADGLITSGVNLVLSQALYAVVGAVALEKGGEVANRIARERILSPMGLSS
ncbi:hypothetical protein MMC24_006424 [Lignoscripta atroalba]|nr:hypothetical protein [Lignoscripta atroalba]